MARLWLAVPRRARAPAPTSAVQVQVSTQTMPPLVQATRLPVHALRPLAQASEPPVQASEPLAQVTRLLRQRHWACVCLRRHGAAGVGAP